MTHGGMWGVLGLEPTTDKGAVRKAYAVGLKAIDIDNDPAAFIRLREAYEHCLRWEDSGQEDEREDWNAAPFERPSPERSRDQIQPWPETSSEPTADQPRTSGEDERFNAYASVHAFHEAFDQAQADGRFEPLAKLYTAGLAAGLIPVGQEQRMHATVVRFGAGDLAAPFAEIRRFAESHAWMSSHEASRRGADNFGVTYAMRLAAEDWYEGQAKLSAQRTAWLRLRTWLIDWPWFAPSPARAARVLFGKVAPWLMREEDAPFLKKALEDWRQYEPYLGARFNDEKLAVLQRRVAFLTRPGLGVAVWRAMRSISGAIAVTIGIVIAVTFALGAMLWLETLFRGGVGH